MNNRKFYEKLLISIVIFLGVSIATGSIIGNFVNQKKEAEEERNNSLILESINLF